MFYPGSGSGGGGGVLSVYPIVYLFRNLGLIVLAGGTVARIYAFQDFVLDFAGNQVIFIL
jgi:hypothetical protein